jgi:endonuclease/exonuclease/phosphatase family metal-dependent hydrolase
MKRQLLLLATAMMASMTLTAKTPKSNADTKDKICSCAKDDKCCKSNNDITLKIMSFNIRFNSNKDSLDKAWERRRIPCGLLVAHHYPDVVGIQESRNEMWEQIYEVMPQYAHFRIATSDSVPDKKTGRILLMYRKDRFEAVDSGYFWLSDTPNRPSHPFNSTEKMYRAAIWLKLKPHDSDRTFYVLTTHLPYKKEPVDNEARISCSTLIVNKMKAIAGDNATIFITGDMNCSYNTDDSRRVGLTPFYTWLESAREKAPDTNARVSFNGFGTIPAGVEGCNLDHIFYRNAAPIKFDTIDYGDYGVRWVSDHYPITCTFTY